MGALIAGSILLCIFILVVLLSRNQAQTTTDSGYSERPKNQTVAQGQTATFRCQHQEAVVGWKVNGTSWTHSSELVGISNEIETVNGCVVSLLHIDGVPEYNSTTVTCDGFFEDGRPNDESVAVLWIQGPLNSPDHLTRTSFNNIIWKAPHSLDITDTELDIVYCVDVIDITCVEEEFLFSDCHVTATYISSGLLRDGRIYRITVTPRSNVVGSLNGTPIVLEENFTLYRRPYVLDISNDHVNITLQPSDVVGMQPTWNSSLVSLVPIDGVDTSTLQIPLTMFNQTKLTLTAVFKDVPENRVFNFSLLADGCSLISQPAVLSTHKIQNISVPPPRPGRIRLAWDFVKSRGPTSDRVLVIVYSTRSDRAYYHIGRGIQRGKKYTNISGLPGDKYYVLVFPFEENGKPFERAANQPISVHVMASRRQNGDDHERQHPYVNSYLKQHQDRIEVGCTFDNHDDPATTCLVMIHKLITRLNKNHLFTIVDSHILERHGNTAYRIIDVNLEEYQVGFVKVKVHNNEDSTNGDSHTIPIIITFVIIILGVIAATIIAFIIILIQLKKRKTTLFPSLMKRIGQVTVSNHYTDVDSMNTSNLSETSVNKVDTQVLVVEKEISRSDGKESIAVTQMASEDEDVHVHLLGPKSIGQNAGNSCVSEKLADKPLEETETLQVPPFPSGIIEERQHESPPQVRKNSSEISPIEKGGSDVCESLVNGSENGQSGFSEAGSSIVNDEEVERDPGSTFSAVKETSTQNSGVRVHVCNGLKCENAIVIQENKEYPNKEYPNSVDNVFKSAKIVAAADVNYDAKKSTCAPEETDGKIVSESFNHQFETGISESGSMEASKNISGDYVKDQPKFKRTPPHANTKRVVSNNQGNEAFSSESHSDDQLPSSVSPFSGNEGT